MNYVFSPPPQLWHPRGMSLLTHHSIEFDFAVPSPLVLADVASALFNGKEPSLLLICPLFFPARRPNGCFEQVSAKLGCRQETRLYLYLFRADLCFFFLRGNQLTRGTAETTSDSSKQMMLCITLRYVKLCVKSSE